MPDKIEEQAPDQLIRMLRLRPRPASRKRLRQIDLAERVGVDVRTIQQWENGERLPSPGSLQQLIRALIQENALLPGEEKAEARQLWEAVSLEFNEKPGTFRLYPPFDEPWLDQLLREKANKRESIGYKDTQSTEALLPVPLINEPQQSRRTKPEAEENTEKSPRTPTNLPTQFTSFVGRTSEIAEIKRLLAATSLVTITGSGGCGKTRLALQTAGALLEKYSDGIWFVELASINDPQLVPHTIAATLDIREQSGQSLLEAIRAFLAERKALLILDSCEHLVDACATLVEALLSVCPALHMLVTSRETLNIDGETVWRVPSLSLPPLQPAPYEQIGQSEAVQLFVERTRAILPHFALSEQNASIIAHICQRLEGIPLAIELAAARTNVLSLEQIATRLTDRFLLLTAGRRTALPHHQTLRAAIDWSYTLLTEKEQTLLRRLSVFAGGCRLEAIETICAWSEEIAEVDAELIAQEEVLDLLSQLVNKSLITVEQAASDQGTRYRLLETIKQYGQEKLEAWRGKQGKEGEVAQQRHAHYYLVLMEQANADFRSSERERAFILVREEYENVRAAFQWSQTADGDPQIGLQLASALYWYWLHTGAWSEGCNRLHMALESSKKSSEVEPVSLSRALHGIGVLARAQGKEEQAYSFAQESVQIEKTAGINMHLAASLRLLVHIMVDRRNLSSARELAEESVQHAREQGELWQIASSLSTLGEVVSVQGDYEHAARLFEESIALFERTGDHWEMTRPLRSLGRIYLLLGDYQRAEMLYKRSILPCQASNGTWFLARSLEGLGKVVSAQGEYVRAATLLGASQGLREALGASVTPHIRDEYEQVVTLLQQKLPEDTFVRAWARGRGMSAGESIDYALGTSVVLQ